jgi:hypothetical protein
MQNNKNRKQERRERVTRQQKWSAKEKRRRIAFDLFGPDHVLTDFEVQDVLRPSKKQRNRNRRNRGEGGTATVVRR